MKATFIIICGACWSLAYAFAIYRAHKDKIYGFPVLAVLLNVSWEFVYGVLYPTSSPVGSVVPIIWLALDLIIFIQVIIFYRRKHVIVFGNRRLPAIPTIIGLLCLSLTTILIGHALDLWLIASAFGQDLLMSILFVRLLFVRKGTLGQSIYVAAFRLVGNGVIVLPLLLFSPEGYWKNWQHACFAAILFFDALYAILLWQKTRDTDRQPARQD